MENVQLTAGGSGERCSQGSKDAGFFTFKNMRLPGRPVGGLSFGPLMTEAQKPRYIYSGNKRKDAGKRPCIQLPGNIHGVS